MPCLMKEARPTTIPTKRPTRALTVSSPGVSAGATVAAALPSSPFVLALGSARGKAEVLPSRVSSTVLGLPARPLPARRLTRQFPDNAMPKICGGIGQQRIMEHDQIQRLEREMIGGAGGSRAWRSIAGAYAGLSARGLKDVFLYSGGECLDPRLRELNEVQGLDRARMPDFAVPQVNEEDIHCQGACQAQSHTKPPPAPRACSRSPNTR
jgi:hypothetical protein